MESKVFRKHMRQDRFDKQEQRRRVGYNETSWIQDCAWKYVKLRQVQQR